MANRNNYIIRPAQETDLAELPQIERRAATLFQTIGMAEVASRPPTALSVLHALKERGQLLVVSNQAGEPLGFAAITLMDREPHLDELSVAPEHSRQGLGAKLLQAVVDWTGKGGHHRVTLSTFRHVPWNAPFYAKHGFTIVQENDLTADLRGLRQAEAQRGLAIDQRVIMQRLV